MEIIENLPGIVLGLRESVDDGGSAVRSGMLSPQPPPTMAAIGYSAKRDASDSYSRR